VVCAITTNAVLRGRLVSAQLIIRRTGSCSISFHFPPEQRLHAPLQILLVLVDLHVEPKVRLCPDRCGRLPRRLLLHQEAAAHNEVSQRRAPRKLHPN
jgi:hypothetical protein